MSIYWCVVLIVLALLLWSRSVRWARRTHPGVMALIALLWVCSVIGGLVWVCVWAVTA